jgi:hypothetical protein
MSPPSGFGLIDTAFGNRAVAAESDRVIRCDTRQTEIAVVMGFPHRGPGMVLAPRVLGRKKQPGCFEERRCGERRDETAEDGNCTRQNKHRIDLIIS